MGGKRCRKDDEDIVDLLVTLIAKKIKTQQGTECSEEDDEYLEDEDEDKNKDEDEKEKDKTKQPHKHCITCKEKNWPAPPIQPTNFAKLLKLAKKCETNNYRHCGRLHKLLPILEKIDQLVGHTSFKESVCKKVVAFCRHKNLPDMYHTIVTGKSGVGKSTVANLLARLYIAMDILQPKTKSTVDERVMFVKRSHLVAGYQGHTTKQTQKVINRAIERGGVMIIDEAYSLHNGSSTEGHDSDSFGSECMNTFTLNMDRYGGKFIAIFIGYEDSIKEHLLSTNRGLERRISWFLHLKPQTAKELGMIVTNTLNRKQRFNIQADIAATIAASKDLFSCYAGSAISFAQTILSLVEISMFGKVDAPVFDLTPKFLSKALEEFKTLKHMQKQVPVSVLSMYM